MLAAPIDAKVAVKLQDERSYREEESIVCCKILHKSYHIYLVTIMLTAFKGISLSCAI